VASLPDPDEAAAISAALQRFLAETAPAAAEEGQSLPAWQRAALLEGVSARPQIGVLHGKGGEKWLS
jgi:hypothetical protein